MNHLRWTSRLLLVGIVVVALGTLGCARRENEAKKTDADVADKSMETKIQDEALVIGRIEIKKGPESDEVNIYVMDEAGKKYAVSNEDQGEKLANLNGAKVRLHGELGTLDKDSLKKAEAGVDQEIHVQSYDILEFASTGSPPPAIMPEDQSVQPDGTTQKRTVDDEGILKPGPEQGPEQKDLEPKSLEPEARPPM